MKTVLELPSVGENFAGMVTPICYTRSETHPDHVHSWANAFSKNPSVPSVDKVDSYLTFFSIRITKDRLHLNQTYAQEQLGLWFANRTGNVFIVLQRLSASDISAGAYSAVPRSLGIAAPTDVFNSSQLQLLIDQARRNLNQTAIEYSNGNPKLAKGIEELLKKALELYEKGTELPLELNLGMKLPRADVITFLFL